MKKISALLATLIFSITNYAHAVPFHFDGDILYANDVVFTHFTLTETKDVDFSISAYFDPRLTLWNADGSKVIDNYEYSFSLAAGDYIVALSMYLNEAIGETLSDGFIYDHYAKLTVSEWNSEFGTHMGSSWTLWISDADSAYVSNPYSIPEPAPLALFLVGLMALGVKRSRKRHDHQTQLLSQ